MPPVVIAVVVIAVLVVVCTIAMLSIRRVAEPNEALIISGVRSHAPESGEGDIGFRIVTGRGTIVIPGVQRVRTLPLEMHKADLTLRCPTSQKIIVNVLGIVAYKVGNDYASISNAAVRFLDHPDRMDEQVHNVFAGHLRSIIGNMTVEELISSRDRMEEETRNASHTEMARFGLVIDSLKIQEITDDDGYIQALATPHIAIVQKSARIAEATNNREAAEQEAAAAAQVAAAQRESAIKQAGYTAEVQQAQATASQAGPLAQAQAQQDVVRQETAVAELTAERRERQLDAEVRKPADAENYRQIKQAEAARQSAILGAQAQAESVKLSATAEAEQTQKVGEAQGLAITARGEAEGRALKARADGLAANQEAVIGQQLAEKVPQIVEAAASAFQHVDSLVVLNGAQGLMAALNSIVGESLASLNTVRHAMNGHTAGNGAVTPTAMEMEEVS